MDRDLEELTPADVADVDDRLSLSGDRALVTGAGNGMGRIAAFTFAAAGADVAVADRLADDLADTAGELETPSAFPLCGRRRTSPTRTRSPRWSTPPSTASAASTCS